MVINKILSEFQSCCQWLFHEIRLQRKAVDGGNKILSCSTLEQEGSVSPGQLIFKINGPGWSFKLKNKREFKKMKGTKKEPSPWTVELEDQWSRRGNKTLLFHIVWVLFPPISLAEWNNLSKNLWPLLEWRQEVYNRKSKSEIWTCAKQAGF